MITHTAQKMKDFFIGIEEVAYSLAGYVAKKLLKCIECESCKDNMIVISKEWLELI